MSGNDPPATEVGHGNKTGEFVWFWSLAELETQEIAGLDCATASGHRFIVLSIRLCPKTHHLIEAREANTSTLSSVCFSPRILLAWASQVVSHDL